jgi:arsenate reductase-like glutaredoxin family protein
MNLHESLSLSPAPMTRFDWQKGIEQNIRAFNADAIEAQEILAALIATLGDRYRGMLADVDHEYEQLDAALKELDNTTPEPTDEDIKAMLADMEYGNDVEEGDWK